MNKYNTQQRNKIIDILSTQEQLLSIKQIQEKINQNSIAVGLTTIYRYLNYLEQEKKVKKCIENGEAKYLLINDLNEQKEKMYIKCEKCNKLYFFDCDEMNEIKKHLANHHDMILDLTRSNMIGRCIECKKKKE